MTHFSSLCHRDARSTGLHNGQLRRDGDLWAAGPSVEPNRAPIALTGAETGRPHRHDAQKTVPEFLQVAQAANRAGIIFTPISTHLKKDETAYIINNCQAKVFIASSSLSAVASEASRSAAGIGALP